MKAPWLRSSYPKGLYYSATLEFEARCTRLDWSAEEARAPSARRAPRSKQTLPSDRSDIFLYKIELYLESLTPLAGAFPDQLRSKTGSEQRAARGDVCRPCLSCLTAARTTGRTLSFVAFHHHVYSFHRRAGPAGCHRSRSAEADVQPQ